VTIARHRTTSLDILGAAMPATPSSAPGTRPYDVPVAPRDIPAPEAVAPAGRLRRCTFRRIDRVEALPGRAPLPTYEVMCLYVDRDAPLALGDIAAARPTCEACSATGIFRPDEA
jgi:hypothetical protein